VLALRPERELDGGDLGEALELATVTLKLEAARLAGRAVSAPRLPLSLGLGRVEDLLGARKLWFFDGVLYGR
jgi:hypothetical protein